MRKITTVRIEENLLEKARNMGINLSKFLEYNLRKIIELYEGKICGRRDFRACLRGNVACSQAMHLNPGNSRGRAM